MTAAPFILAVTFYLAGGDSFTAYEDTDAQTVEACHRDAARERQTWLREWREMKAGGMKPFFTGVDIQCEFKDEDSQ